MTLFGRNAEAMLPIMALGADGIAQYRQEAHELGLVMGEENLKAANNFRMEVDQLKQQLGAVAREMGVELIPAFKDFIDWLQAAAPHIIDFTKLLIKGGKMILWPFLRFFEAVGKGFDFLMDRANDAIDVYNKVADEMKKVGIEMGRLSHIDMSSPIEDLGRTTSTTLDEMQDDYAAAQDAMSDPVMPGWAGQTEYIKAELERTGARNIDELQEVYRGEPTAPTPAVYTGAPTAAGAGTTGTSAVSMLMSIDAGIEESNRLSAGIIAAVKAIRIGAPSMGGFGGGGGGNGGGNGGGATYGDLTISPTQLKNLKKSVLYTDLSKSITTGGF